MFRDASLMKTILISSYLSLLLLSLSLLPSIFPFCFFFFFKETAKHYTHLERNNPRNERRERVFQVSTDLSFTSLKEKLIYAELTWLGA